MDFRIHALDHQLFERYFIMTDEELSALNIQRMIVDEKPGYPCRVSLEDADIGEEVLLLPYQHHRAASPYQASGPIFVRRGINRKSYVVNQVPIMMNHRLLSYRGYDVSGIMKNAITDKGINTPSVIQAIFQNQDIYYIHIHNSSPGCYNCEVRRA